MTTADPFLALERKHVGEAARDLRKCHDYVADVDRLLQAPEHPADVESSSGELILDEMVSYIRRFVSLSEAQADLAALWTAHTHAIAAADATPYLAITSAEKQCGKTQLLEVLETIVHNPWLTGKVSAAVLIRKIDAVAPTLLLDESDTAFGGDKEYAEALRGVLNTGHKRSGKASCCVGQGAALNYKDFSTFGPKAIAGIGKLPGTVADRAIPIRLKRAPRGQKIARWRPKLVVEEAEALKARIAEWCGSDAVCEKLRAMWPALPDKLSDRQQDGAEPLLAIADLAGGEWPKRARKAVESIFAGPGAEDDSNGVVLLTDIRATFEQNSEDQISSQDLADKLAGIESSPWGEWHNGKPISKIQLAKLLKLFEITPRQLWQHEKNLRGYAKADFTDAWSRYLAPETEAAK